MGSHLTDVELDSRRTRLSQQHTFGIEQNALFDKENSNDFLRNVAVGPSRLFKHRNARMAGPDDFGESLVVKAGINGKHEDVIDWRHGIHDCLLLVWTQPQCQLRCPARMHNDVTWKSSAPPTMVIVSD